MNTPLLHETQEKVVFPNICLRCGRDSRHKISVLACSRSQEKDLAILKRVPHGHLIALFSKFLYKTVKIPLCWRCHINQIVPATRVWLPILVVLALLPEGVYMSIHDRPEYGLPCLFLAITITLIVARAEKTRQKAAALPIKVYYENNRFQYYVWGGPLYEFLLAMHGK